LDARRRRCRLGPEDSFHPLRRPWSRYQGKLERLLSGSRGSLLSWRDTPSGGSAKTLLTILPSSLQSTSPFHSRPSVLDRIDKSSHVPYSSLNRGSQNGAGRRTDPTVGAATSANPIACGRRWLGQKPAYTNLSAITRPETWWASGARSRRSRARARHRRHSPAGPNRHPS
jgi:hypothetical protein